MTRLFSIRSVNGRVVHGRVDAPTADGTHPTLICLHGFRAHMDWGFFPDFALRAAAQGWCVLRLSFSGAGVPPGADDITDLEAFARDTYGKQLEDLEAVHAALDDGAFPEADPARWSILGHSRGSGIALIHAAERQDARAFIGWAQITTPGSWSAEKKQRWRDEGALRIQHGAGGGELLLGTDVLDDLEAQVARFDLHARAAELNCPALMLHGSRDIAIPHAEARAGFEALPQAATLRAGRELADATAEDASGTGPQPRDRFRVIERTGHTFGVHHPMERVPGAYLELARETLAFLVEHGQ